MFTVAALATKDGNGQLVANPNIVTLLPKSKNDQSPFISFEQAEKHAQGLLERYPHMRFIILSAVGQVSYPKDLKPVTTKYEAETAPKQAPALEVGVEKVFNADEIVWNAQEGQLRPAFR